MTLTPNSRLGPYELVALIGVGGMGEVYRARDTKLERDVALKILPDALADDPDRLARFRREAQVLASLNHPNIASIYGLEEDLPPDSGRATKVLILELVDGSTLADRLADGRILLDEALPIAKQIASALEAAHEAGVVHRDLKPANIMLRRDGTVKVLDFGLAKAVVPKFTAAPASNPSRHPPALAATEIATVMGTAPYMSPEQARGNPVDPRTDIWAFGCVLFEILTQRAPFGGDSATDTLAQIINREPDWGTLPANTPPAVQTLLRRCLAKNPQERLPHIGAARLEIADAINRQGAGRPSLSRSRRPLRIAAGLAALAAVASIVWLLRESGPTKLPPTVSRVSIDPSPGESWVISPHDPDFAISPDGERIAYIARRASGNELVVRRLDQFQGASLGSFGGAVRHPFFSPDGKWLAFVDGSVLKKMSVDGTGAVTVCALPGYMSGATWGTDNVITFGTLNNGLFRVSSAGGTPAVLATEAQRNGRNARWPETLPGANAVLFASAGVGESEIRVRLLATDEERVVVRAATFPRYASTGHLLYVAQGALWGVRFDADKLVTVGDPEPIVDGVMIKGPPQAGMGAADVAIAANGTLVYRPSATAARGADTLVWVDRDGREEPLNLDARAYGRMRLSPDGSKIAVEVTDTALSNTDIWAGDVHGAALMQLTFDAAVDGYPLWTTDGEHVVFTSNRQAAGLYRKRTDATSPEELLRRDGDGPAPYFVTPDGSLVVYMRTTERPSTRRYFGLRLDGSGEELPLALNPGPVSDIDPSGQWMAYSSEETGNFEVYVQPYPNAGGAKWKITTGGGRDPLWSRDGRELYYQNDTTMFAAAVTTGTGHAFAAAPAVALFEGPYLDSSGRWYDVAPDGRFVMVKPGWLNAARETPLNVVLNWFAELDARLPR